MPAKEVPAGTGIIECAPILGRRKRHPRNHCNDDCAREGDDAMCFDKPNEQEGVANSGVKEQPAVSVTEGCVKVGSKKPQTRPEERQKRLAMSLT